MNFNIAFFSAVGNAVGILTRTALNLCMSFGRMAILTKLGWAIQKQGKVCKSREGFMKL